MRRIARTALALAFALLLGACAAARPDRCPAGADPVVSESLYFGTATPDGVVSDEKWAAFLRDDVTPRFPDGLTTWTASGQWRGKDGIIVREKSHVLQLLHDVDEPVDADISAIITAYKLRFRQESVLRVTAPACTSS